MISNVSGASVVCSVFSTLIWVSVMYWQESGIGTNLAWQESAVYKLSTTVGAHNCSVQQGFHTIAVTKEAQTPETPGTFHLADLHELPKAQEISLQDPTSVHAET